MTFGMILHCDCTYEDGSTCDAFYKIYYPITIHELRRVATQSGWSSTAGPPISDYCPQHNPYKAD